METQMDTPTARPSLLLLNKYCLLEISEFMDIDHLINLAKTCNYLRFIVDRTFKKHSNFRLSSRMVKKGENYVKCLFKHIGQHVTFLDFRCDFVAYENLSKILGKISNNCKNLKKLDLTYRNSSSNGDVKPYRLAYRFDNVEQLTLYQCCEKLAEHFTTHFFESFPRLKYLNIHDSCIKSNELKTIFENSRGIESFVFAWNNLGFNCQLLELIPNVPKLCLINPYCDILKIESLLKLNRLTKLRLGCYPKNMNNFLRELASKGIIEEMDLEIEVNDELFDTLTSFSKLQLLVLSARSAYFKLKSSFPWPAQLKKLRLEGFVLPQPNVISMMQQLKSIESIDFGKCLINRMADFSDLTKLSQDIRHIIDHSNRRQRLDVVLPYVKPSHPPKKYLIESEHLRTLDCRLGEYNPLGIEIHFDGCDFL